MNNVVQQHKGRCFGSEIYCMGKYLNNNKIKLIRKGNFKILYMVTPTHTKIEIVGCVNVK